MWNQEMTKLLAKKIGDFIKIDMGWEDFEKKEARVYNALLL